MAICARTFGQPALDIVVTLFIRNVTSSARHTRFTGNPLVGMTPELNKVSLKPGKAIDDEMSTWRGMGAAVTGLLNRN